MWFFLESFLTGRHVDFATSGIFPDDFFRIQQDFESLFNLHGSSTRSSHRTSCVANRSRMSHDSRTSSMSHSSRTRMSHNSRRSRMSHNSRRSRMSHKSRTSRMNHKSRTSRMNHKSRTVATPSAVLIARNPSRARNLFLPMRTFGG